MTDRDLGIPGEEHSLGAADFVSWYDAHPDVPQEWPLDATSVAVLGVGNVALDVARVLAKTGEEMLVTDIPPHVHAGLVAKTITDVHVFARRGPAYAKFSPLESARDSTTRRTSRWSCTPRASTWTPTGWRTSPSTRHRRWCSTR
ncbi:hypothetical protein [Nocardioides convexus]|uniref:hypothetical protein n=1 Tax=Nocardioides convexus TaxID=2712224 RepID=UPI0024186995|nr:hypothetical protein [Nocardioides convexus]